MIYNEDVLLVALSCLHCPVERASDQVSVVYNCELVVHVILDVIVSPNWNSLSSKPLYIAALVIHALVI